MNVHDPQIGSAPASAHALHAHPTRSFEEALRDLVRQSPYLVVSLVAHLVALLALLATLRESAVVLEPDRAIVASRPTPPADLVEPEPVVPEVVDEVAPFDDPTVTDQPVPDAVDPTPPSDAPRDTSSASLASAVGLGGGAAGFASGTGTKLDGRGTRASPHQPSVDAALRWLANHQAPAGYWSANAFSDQCGKQGDDVVCDGRGKPVHDVGVSGLALLAFLGAGHTPHRGEHADHVKAGVRWLREVQAADGNFGDPRSNLHTYDHTLATLAMLEAAVLSGGDHRLRRSAQRGVDYLLALRNPGGAWRYADPRSDEMLRHPDDTSVTGWVVMVLTLAEEAGMDVDPAALDDAHAFLEEMTDPVTGRTGYTTRGGRSARPPGVADIWPPERTEAMTAVALLARVFLDPELERPQQRERVARGAELLTALPVRWSDDPDDLATRDFYYWYAASNALYQLGGEAWRRWEPGLAQIAEHQVASGEAAGSWDPAQDPWGADGGRVYSTALLALTLEVHARYDTVLGPRR